MRHNPDVYAKNSGQAFNLEMQASDTNELPERTRYYQSALYLDDLNDRAYKYFFIAKNYDKLLNEEQKAFLRLVTSNESTSIFAEKVSKLVDNAKQNTQWRKQFMDFQHYMSQSFREGKQAKAIEAAINLLKMNKLTPDEIAQAQGLPLEKVLELQQQLLVKV